VARWRVRRRLPGVGGSTLLALLAWFASPAHGAYCDVGYIIDAYHTGTTVFEAATIVRIDLSVPNVYVTWASGSPSFRTITIPNTRKDGAPCTFQTTTGQTFSANSGVKTHFLVRGANLTEAVRLLITASTKVCGEATASQDASVTSAPGVPIGVGDMYFFDVAVSTPGSYKFCFWSGYSVSGKGAGDIISYATTLGPFTVSQAVTTITTTTMATTVWSRRRGLSYASASFRVDGDSGFIFDSLTANPAAWNMYAPRERDPTCRSCQRYSMLEVDRNVQRLEVNRISGALQATYGASTSVLGEGCEDDAVVNRTAPQAPPAVLMARRGGCSFEEKARVAALAGFSAVLVVDNLAESNDQSWLPDMSLAGGAVDEASSTLPPAWFVPKTEGDTIFALLSANAVLTASLEDVQRKPRLSTALSDAFGVRSYETK